MAQQRPVLQWASSSLGSTGYVIVSVLAATANKFTDTRNASMSTSGASENMLLINDGIVDFGQTSSADYPPAYAGTGQFEGDPLKVWQLFAYTAWQLSPMVRSDSGITSISELVGRRVMPAMGGGTTHNMWRDILAAAGISEDQVDWSHGSWSETYDAMKKNAVDVIPVLLTNGRPSGRVTELEASGVDMTVLDIPDEVFAAVQSSNPGILKTNMTPDDTSSKFVKKPTNMVTLGGILGVNPNVSEDVVYDIVKSIMENTDYVHSKGSEVADISPEFGVNNLMTGFPVHPGAARYFQEAGIWRDELTIG
jgi:TRAP transporter TAXI family solute receptor